MRDPFVLAHEGFYYLYGSTDPDIWRGPGIGFDVYVGAAPGIFTDFGQAQPAFRPPAGFWSQTNFWAPEVYPWNGDFIMFATFLPINGQRGTAVLRATSPLGPFLPFSTGPVTPPDWACLDGSLVIDQAGDPWMVFCHEWTQVGDGQICALRLTADLRAGIGQPQVLFSASQAGWSAPLAGRPAGGYVTDGPNLRYLSDGRLAMVWSSFDRAGRYAIGLALSDSGAVTGGWRQVERPLWDGDGGHGMVFADPDNRLFLAIHTPNASPNERPIFIGLNQTDAGLTPTGQVIR